MTWLLTCLFHPLLTAEIKSDLLLISSCPFDMRHRFFPRADPRLPHLPGAIQPSTSLRGPSLVTASLQVFSEHMSFGEHCSGALILKSSKGAFSNRMCHCAEVWGMLSYAQGLRASHLLWISQHTLCNEEVSKQSVPNPSLFLLTHRTLYSSKTGQRILFLPQHPLKVWGDTEDAAFELGVQGTVIIMATLRVTMARTICIQPQKGHKGTAGTKQEVGWGFPCLQHAILSWHK